MPDKKEETKKEKDNTVPGYSGSPHEGEKAPDAVQPPKEGTQVFHGDGITPADKPAPKDPAYEEEQKKLAAERKEQEKSK